ncbi:unnamed protein product [Didymodactylos carnosus]|uniref:Glycolipid transfer protein domain-containing protein n=1 Tax=Didymodactylos carnosus TaxID=1234261 RepID=A0A814W6U9_9BILA|nr:unnamed protein product [Didymodactylos carnosus]CAF1198402.1 unnamed protein product [Didymodactylos carnosus]CAF3950923.1 unnamed protein product [Didymodactylos carnosus]CAF3962811.1 unnamed protein product [Didymodactylos carnosus]
MDSIRRVDQLDTDDDGVKHRSDSITGLQSTTNDGQVRSTDAIEPLPTISLSNNSKDFDVYRLYTSFVSALRFDDKIGLTDYIVGFRELTKFFDQLGLVFVFVKNEVEEKLNVLQAHVNSGKKSHYDTVQKAVDYEIQNNLLTTTTSAGPSAARTLLRLHRAMNFIKLFLKCLADDPVSDSSATIAKRSYDKTLAAHHNYFVKLTVRAGFFSLPDRKKLDEIIFKGKKEELNDQFHRFIDTLNKIYAIIDRLYEDKGLLNLP